MPCMKCGRETAADAIFCDECLEQMRKYPIKPGTVALIPPQPPQQKRSSERRAPTTEQRLATLTRRVRTLAFLLTLTVALLIGVGALTISLLREGENATLPGQNYATATSEPTDDVSRETSEPIA